MEFLQFVDAVVAIPPVAVTKSEPDLLPMTEDWRPDDKSWRLALDKLGEGAALRCLANYRDHQGAAGKPMTQAQRDAKFRIWVRNERNRAIEPLPELPLMRSIDGGGAGQVAGKVYIRPETHRAQWDAHAKHRGEQLPTNKGGGWWVDSEWPPATEPRRECG